MTLEEQLLAGIGDSDNSGFTVDLGGDNKLNFKTQEELSENLRQALSHVNLEVTRIKEENERLKNERLQTQNQPKYAESDEQNVTTKFNMDHFITQMKANPPEALDYATQFSPKQKELTEALKQFHEMKQEQEVGKWLQAHPEFPGGQAAYILNQVREELQQPMNKLGLEAAYNHAIQNQKLPDFRLQQALNNQQQSFMAYLQQNNIPLPQTQNQTQQRVNNVPQQQNPYPVMSPQGIPTVPRNQNAQYTPAEQSADNMSLEQLEKILKANGML